MGVYRFLVLQWNLSNPDANGAEESVTVSEVSSLQNARMVKRCSLIRSVRAFCLTNIQVNEQYIRAL